jgi:hypothetical protein
MTGENTNLLAPAEAVAIADVPAKAVYKALVERLPKACLSMVSQTAPCTEWRAAREVGPEFSAAHGSLFGEPARWLRPGQSIPVRRHGRERQAFG